MIQERLAFERSISRHLSVGVRNRANMEPAQGTNQRVIMAWRTIGAALVCSYYGRLFSMALVVFVLLSIEIELLQLHGRTLEGGLACFYTAHIPLC